MRKGCDWQEMEKNNNVEIISPWASLPSSPFDNCKCMKCMHFHWYYIVRWEICSNYLDKIGLSNIGETLLKTVLPQILSDHYNSLTKSYQLLLIENAMWYYWYRNRLLLYCNNNWRWYNLFGQSVRQKWYRIGPNY